LNLSDEEIKVVEAEEDEGTAAMLVTVEEDNGTMIKRSQITAGITSKGNANQNKETRRNLHDSGHDLSLHNHLSVRDFSPSASHGDTE
jgi:hypothetical protein